MLDKKARALFPFIRVIFADGGYQGPVAAAMVSAAGDWQLSIVKRSDQAKGFVVLPKRRLVERTLAWLTRCRRLVRHYELSLQTSIAFIRGAVWEVVGIRGWRNLRLVQVASTGVGAPGEITP